MEPRVRNSLWYLLRAYSAEARRDRRRLGVGIAFAVFLGGLLTAIGFVIVVLALALAIVALVAVTSAVHAVQRNRRELQRVVRTAIAQVTQGFSRLGAVGRRVADVVAAHTSSALRTARQHIFGSEMKARAARGRRVADVAAAHTSTALRSGRRHIVEAVMKAREARARQTPKNIELQREALRLNAAGTQRRRDGAPADAIRLHTQALEVLRDAHDPHAAALIQNNLALALSRVGEDGRATTLFEQAAATARDLGDADYEGRIMANLAIAQRRRGLVDECDDILRVALTKLRRDSSAYRRVEAELARTGS